MTRRKIIWLVAAGFAFVSAGLVSLITLSSGQTANKFKCPCHGSGFCMGSAFDGNGINSEGPAPRPLDRVHVELDPEGQVVANISKLYRSPKGQHLSLTILALTFR